MASGSSSARYTTSRGAFRWREIVVDGIDTIQNMLSFAHRPSPIAYIPDANMMCAFGVPGNISQGSVSNGFVDSPVVAAVANGM